MMTDGNHTNPHGRDIMTSPSRSESEYTQTDIPQSVHGDPSSLPTPDTEPAGSEPTDDASAAVPDEDDDESEDDGNVRF